MRQYIDAFKNKAYQQSSTHLLLFFMSWGIWWSFFSLWLTDTTVGLGLDGTRVGTIYSINGVATLALMLVYGPLQDRLRTRRTLAIAIAAVMTLVGPFFVFCYQPMLSSDSNVTFHLGAVIGAIFLSAGFLSACGLLEALSERLSRKHEFEYGQARMWGSFGYAVVALIAGFLFTTNPQLNFWGGSICGLLLLLALLFWREPRLEHPEQNATATAPTPSLAEMGKTLTMPALWIVIVIVFFSWTFYTVFDQQMFPPYYTSLFGDAQTGQQMYGILNSVQVFLEAAMMGVVPIIMRKIGVKNTLMIGFLVMALRIGLCGVFADPISISFVKMFHALEVPLFILPIFRYFTIHFNPALSATLYMVGFNISSQLGNVVISPILGRVRDALGFHPTFFIISGIVICAGVFAWFALKDDKKDVDGEPFFRDSEEAERLAYEQAQAQALANNANK